MRPVIGIPLCLDDRGRWRPGRDYSYIDHAYAHAVEEAGGTPLHLPIQQDIESVVARIDALLLPGGDDFLPPVPYPDAVEFDPVPEAQLAFDRSLLDAASSRELPILGICYGMQLLALQRGGTLHYHLPTDLPQAHPHQLPESPGARTAASRHGIELIAGSRVAQALRSETAQVNSLHHQALATPGRGLRVSALAGDGVIEAIESTEPQQGPFCVGVQWHPEKLEKSEREPLFRALVEACSGA